MRLVFIILFLLYGACVDPLQVKVSNSERRLVVDGLITSQPGPYKIRLYYSKQLGTARLAAFEPATNASVVIVDDQANLFYLFESSPGVYETLAGLTGQIGRSYHLEINAADAKMYRSAPQKMAPPGQIDEINFLFEKDVLPNNEDLTDALQVFIDSHGEPEGSNLYRWRWTAVNKARAFPELKVTPTPGGDRPTPEPCSGFIFTRGQLEQVGECTCCICWSYDYSEGAFVSQNTFVNENVFNNQFLGRIPITPMHFYDRYHIEVQQLSLSQEAYDFWNLIGKQQKGASDLFQPNAIKIRGNIRCITDPAEEVLGFFGVSGAHSKSIFIDPQHIPYTIPEPDTIPFSCLDYFKNPTTEEPAFW